MYHTIEFLVDFKGDREISPRHHLERVVLRKGTRVRAELKPHVIQAGGRFIEAADLYLDDGTVTRDVPYVSFSFVD